MPKNKTIFVCSECGNESSKWLGKCPACNSWNTFYEQKIVETKNSIKETKSSIPQALNSYEAKDLEFGKSTLILQICDKIKGDGKVLYVSRRRIGRTNKTKS